jgi:hypothetical protein
VSNYLPTKINNARRGGGGIIIFGNFSADLTDILLHFYDFSLIFPRLFDSGSRGADCGVMVRLVFPRKKDVL